MSVVCPNYVPVLPSDIQRAGLDGACLLALVRFVTQIKGSGDRILIDGEIWWRASYAEIGESLGGVNRQVINRLVDKLENDGHLQVQQPLTEDRRKLYRVASEQPLLENETPLSSHYSNPIDQTSNPIDSCIEFEVCTTYPKEPLRKVEIRKDPPYGTFRSAQSSARTLGASHLEKQLPKGDQ
ncbi:hypothetical protein [Mycobacterium sp. 852002-50816_SCH5313054-b]|uniref:hypothetical protein n=1 Tax=Mycobacterium sp. 852002-50816_SCH5313054-b TaxID=1834092 RepID=UPI0012E9B083|nr:hypothetical protein [Mycobacterium sp. 852002-50816_SCH5313054-b]